MWSWICKYFTACVCVCACLSVCVCWGGGTSNHNSAWNCYLKSRKQVSFITLCLCGLSSFLLYFRVRCVLWGLALCWGLWCSAPWWALYHFSFVPSPQASRDWQTHSSASTLSCDWGLRGFSWNYLSYKLFICWLRLYTKIHVDIKSVTIKQTVSGVDS